MAHHDLGAAFAAAVLNYIFSDRSKKALGLRQKTAALGETESFTFRRESGFRLKHRPYKQRKKEQKHFYSSWHPVGESNPCLRRERAAS